MQLAGKVAIVTGGGSGMGREICLEFAQEGAALVVASNVPAQIEEVAAECRAQGARAVAAYADVSVEADVKALVERCLREYGKVDVLVSAAGIGLAQLGVATQLDTTETTLEQWRRIYEVNVFGVYLCAREVVAPMAANGGGSIMNFASGTVRFPGPGLGPYTSSKFAVEGFTKILAQEVERQNIRANCLQPGGLVDTALIGPERPAAERESFHQPSVIRKCAVWLASDESRFITGRSIVAAAWNQERGLVLCPCRACSQRAARTPIEARGVTAL